MGAAAYRARREHNVQTTESCDRPGRRHGGRLRLRRAGRRRLRLRLRLRLRFRRRPVHHPRASCCAGRASPIAGTTFWSTWPTASTSPPRRTSGTVAPTPAPRPPRWPKSARRCMPPGSRSATWSASSASTSTSIPPISSIPDEIGNGVDPNPYWPLTAGHTHVIVGEGEVTVVTATDEVRDVGGLPCRVIRDLVFEEGEDDGGEIEYEAVEVTQDWYAQHVDGDVDLLRREHLRDRGRPDRQHRRLVRQRHRPRPGGLSGARVSRRRRGRPAGDGDGRGRGLCRVREPRRPRRPTTKAATSRPSRATAPACRPSRSIPRDPGQAEYKYYLPGTGFVLAVKLDEDGEPTGEREEVTCIGDSLDVLDDPACGIADPDALLDALCVWAPEALCDD